MTSPKKEIVEIIEILIRLLLLPIKIIVRSFLGFFSRLIREMKQGWVKEAKKNDSIFQEIKQYYVKEWIKEEKVDELEGRIQTVVTICFIVLVMLLIFLILLPAEADFKVGVFLTYLLISIIAVIISVRKYAISYPINEYIKSKLASDTVIRIGAYTFPIPLIAFFIIYYLDIPLPAYPFSFTLFDWNFITFSLGVVTFLNYGSLAVAIPPLVSKEYNFYVALRYFTKIAHSDTHEKIKLLIKGTHIINI